MNITPLNAALAEMCDARKNWRRAMAAYETVNAARQVAETRLASAHRAMDAAIDVETKDPA